MSLRKFTASAFFSIRIFAILLALLVFGFFLFLGKFSSFPILHNLETELVDFHFILKSTLLNRNSQQANVFTETRSRKLSPDIILVAIDNRSINTFGKWPFPRSIHAELLNSFTRIQQQDERESSVFLDILFNAVGDKAFDDVTLIESIKDNGRVLLQTQLLPQAGGEWEDDYNRRFRTLIENYGEITDVRGDLTKVRTFYSIESPLLPYSRAVNSYGHANFSDDFDKIYRRQRLIARYGEKISDIALDELQADVGFKLKGRYHLAWADNRGNMQRLELPLGKVNMEEIRRMIQSNAVPFVDAEGNQSWKLTLYRDHFVPASTLSLALEYFNKTPADIEVHYGSHVRIPDPMHWNHKKGVWEAYKLPSGLGASDSYRQVDEIRIPVDENGNMQINFMGRRSSADIGGIQTFPVRSYAAYAANSTAADSQNWPQTKGLGGKIMMVGAFTAGMAYDEKPTPLGLMFGVEIHANALNTIIMDNFIHYPPVWVNTVILFVLVMLVAFMASRMRSLGWSLVILMVFIVLFFVIVNLIFETSNIVLDWVTPVLAVIFTFIFVVLYRVFVAERDRKHIKAVFGQFISPAIVDKLSSSPPELGGEDLEMTIFFSDIRGFSRISENLSAQELVKLLNLYLTDMTDNIVEDFHGTLDKYIGDAIMAFWGAPQSEPDHAVLACKCALMQIRLVKNLNATLKSREGEGYEDLRIGIGLNSGKTMVGYMGSEGRKNYTVMGDTVNLASRLEGVNKTYSTSIIISENTRRLIQHEPFIVRELDVIRVKGRLKPEKIFELIDYEGKLLPDKKIPLKVKQ